MIPDKPTTPATKEYKPFVPPSMAMSEFTLRALLLGLVMTIVLGAANAYLGLRAGQTIAATYPAAVIGMAVLRLFRGSILEENMARTVGSIGESVAAGAIFTIPAFIIVHAWPAFDTFEAYWQSTALMMVGGVLGILFVTLLRRVMVEDPELPYPESAAAAEIHKAGQRGSDAAKTLFTAMGAGGLTYLLGEFKLFSASREFLLHVGEIGKSFIKLGADRVVNVGGVTKFSLPAVSPAYLGVGYIIGIKLGSLNFAGGLLGWSISWGRSWPRRSPPAPATTPGMPSPVRCGATSCAPSRWAACWWAPATPCSGCAIASRRASSALSRTCAKPAANQRPPIALKKTSALSLSSRDWASPSWP
jgi:uncharacterized oligopeptide transporter (OPT) family protein